MIWVKSVIIVPRKANLVPPNTRNDAIVIGIFLKHTKNSLGFLRRESLLSSKQYEKKVFDFVSILVVVCMSEYDR